MRGYFAVILLIGVVLVLLVNCASIEQPEPEEELYFLTVEKDTGIVLITEDGTSAVGISASSYSGFAVDDTEKLLFVLSGNTVDIYDYSTGDFTLQENFSINVNAGSGVTGIFCGYGKVAVVTNDTDYAYFYTYDGTPIASVRFRK